MHPNDKRGSYHGGHGHSGRWGDTNGRKFSERRGGSGNQRQQHQRNRWNDNPQQYQRHHGDNNRNNHYQHHRYDERRRNDNHNHQSSSSSQDVSNSYSYAYDRHGTSTSYGPNGNGRYRDQQNREGSDGRRLKEPPPQSNLKRPASPLKSGSVGNTTTHQKRAKESTTTAPTEQSHDNIVESMKISAAVAVGTSFVSNDEFVIPETEEAHRAAYVECLRECDKEIFGVPNQAHQEPGRFRWKEWNKKKQAAVQSTLEEMTKIKLREHNKNSQYCSSSESEEIDYPGGGGQEKSSAELTRDEIGNVHHGTSVLPSS